MANHALASFINKLPYTGRSDRVPDLLNILNPKYKLFHEQGGKREEIINRLSVSSNYPDTNPAGSIAIDKAFYAFMYAEADSNKQKRINDYRTMACFSEVADALDEICDECLVVDDEGTIAKLQYKQAVDLEAKHKQELDEELRSFLVNIDLKHKGWQYFRTLLVEGEVFWENVISKNQPQHGILGFINVPTELIDPVYDNIQNMLIKGFMLRKPNLKSIDEKNKQTSIATNSTGPNDQKYIYIPLDKNQVTYVNSDTWNPNKTIRTPLIENARRAYRQLALIEDSIVIYRLVRAPERLVFNVDVGSMAGPKAEQYLQKLMKNYWSRKTYDNDQGKSVLTYNPQSMLDSFWFAKREGSTGTSVTQLQGGQNLGELTDLMYFVKKLYKSLKVPTNRLNEESRYEDSATILREELKFAKFIIRLQEHFAAGLKQSFIVHLKLKGLWDAFNLHDMHFDIIFNPPSNFHELREQQLRELKFNAFNGITSNPFISTSFAMKKYLGWSDIDIQANREFLKKDAGLKWEIAQIETSGPEWREMAEQAAADGAPGGAPAGGGMGGGMPPGFGGPIGAAAGGPEGQLDPNGEEVPVQPAVPGGAPQIPQVPPANQPAQ